MCMLYNYMGNCLLVYNAHRKLTFLNPKSYLYVSEIFPIEGNTDFNNICFLRRNTQLTEQLDFFSVIR